MIELVSVVSISSEDCSVSVATSEVSTIGLLSAVSVFSEACSVSVITSDVSIIELLSAALLIAILSAFSFL